MTETTNALHFGVAAIRDLKAELRRSIQAAVDAFEARTGMTPAAIDVTIIENTHLRSELKHYCVGDVTVKLGDF